MTKPKHITTERALLAKAAKVLGTREAAKMWLSTPAMALDNKRPAELLSTRAGVDSVERLLGQMEHCVYV
jgi:putative toxin-antitoxin system antitoxin component (TIGR02293 family)